MEKLIISCCINDSTSWEGCWGSSKNLRMPVTAREIADSVRAARDAGATIVRVNEPLTKGGKDTMGFNGEAWLEVANLIRHQASDVIYEHGSFGRPYFGLQHYEPPVPSELRRQTFDLGAEKPDMIDSLLAEVDHDFGLNYFLMPYRNEIAKWMQLCRENGVKPSFESWHIGHLFELEALAEARLIDPPYWVTLFIGSTSGVGSPSTTKELLHHVKHVPKNTLWQLSVLCGLKGSASTQQQLNLLTQAITLGGHVRVGMEDNPYYLDKIPAKSNAQLVERVVRIARELCREIASPAEARQILGLPKHK